MALNLVLIGVAIALDPLPLMAFLVVLPSKRGVRKGAAFVFGWLASLGIVVSVTVLATGNNPRRNHRSGRHMWTACPHCLPWAWRPFCSRGA